MQDAFTWQMLIKNLLSDPDTHQVLEHRGNKTDEYPVLHDYKQVMKLSSKQISMQHDVLGVINAMKKYKAEYGYKDEWWVLLWGCREQGKAKVRQRPSWS